MAGPLPLITAPPARTLEEEGARLGLSEQTRRTGSRTMKGLVAGRLFTVTVHPRTRTRYNGKQRYRVHAGFRLIMETPCSTDGRLVVAPRRLVNRLIRWLNRKGGLLPVVMGPEWKHTSAWSCDAEWASDLLQAERTQEPLRALLPGPPSPEVNSLQWYPDRLGFNTIAHSPELVANLEAWLRHTAALAEATLERPPPARKHEPGWMEKHPLRLIVLVVAGFLLTGLLFCFFLIGLTFFVNWVTHR